MYAIHLHDLSFRASVGLYPEEKILGTELILHVNLEMTNTYDASSHDYVDYVRVHEIISEILKSDFDLLEKVADAIIQKLFFLYDKIQQVIITIEKIHPPIKQFEGKVSVTVSKIR